MKETIYQNIITLINIKAKCWFTILTKVDKEERCTTLSKVNTSMYQTNKQLQSLAYKKKSRLVVEGSEKVTLEVETSSPLLYPAI